VQRISDLTHEGIIGYNLRDGGTAVTIFADAQSYRVDKARSFVAGLLGYVGAPDRARIVELGCSAGDIVGPFAAEHDVWGVDVVPAAVELTRERYPAMKVDQAVVETIEPQPCDILVLCEFLEHIDDPDALVRAWLPLAKYAVIGHPLNDPGGIEPGHIWSYTLDDYRRWHTIGAHGMIETHLFSGPFPEMVMGVSGRL
jgi:hypothetical protein